MKTLLVIAVCAAMGLTGFIVSAEPASNTLYESAAQNGVAVYELASGLGHDTGRP